MAASLDDVLVVPPEAQRHYDAAIKNIKSGRFKNITTGVKVSPNKISHIAATGAIAKSSPALADVTSTAKVATVTEPVVPEKVVAIPVLPQKEEQTRATNASVQPEIGPNKHLLSSMSGKQITAVQAQAAQRLNRPVSYQPHPSAPSFSVIPAGRFRMGDIQGEGDFDEGPVRELEIAKAFGMSSTEISFEVWLRCVDAGECSDALHKQRGGDKGWGRGKRPVINISWSEIQNQFIPWLNRITGEHFRLPTEAEWEYAARAGSDKAYSFGNKASREHANFGKEKCCGGVKKGQDKWEFTAPVESLKPNNFGLYDMHGNVYEWVADCYSGNYEASQNKECLSGKRVARGGSWYDAASSLRSANRVKFSEGFRIIYLGFRLVHVVE